MSVFKLDFRHSHKSNLVALSWTAVDNQAYTILGAIFQGEIGSSHAHYDSFMGWI